MENTENHNQVERELETEYKAMLSKEQFRLLNKYFATFAEIKEPYIQINYYFDQDDFRCIHHGITIRLRHKNKKWKLQMKVPDVSITGQYNQHHEFHQTLSEEKAKHLIKSGLQLSAFFSDSVLKELPISLGHLKMIGSLQTKRHDYIFYTDTISLDESTYLDVTDYELEWETTNHKYVSYELSRLNIIPKSKVGKITRFLEQLKKK